MKNPADAHHPLEALANELAGEWRAVSKVLEDHAATGAAQAYQRCAAALLERAATYLDEALDVQEIAEESGYHPVHVARLIDQGTLPAAKAGEKVVRRRDLPRKPGHGTAAPAATVGPARTRKSEIARQVAQGKSL